MFIYYINVLSYNCRVFIAQMKQIKYKYNYEKLTPEEQIVLLIVLLSGAAICIIYFAVGFWTWEMRAARNFLNSRPTDEQIKKCKEWSLLTRFAVIICIRQMKEEQRERDEAIREYMINKQNEIMANERITAKLKRVKKNLFFTLLK